MHFIEICDSIAEKLDLDLKGHTYGDLNSQDKGELCELFVRAFLEEALGDNYRIFRGGKIITAGGGISRQIDIILCARSAINFFSHKGKYPTEIVKGAVSVTATLDLSKLDDCLAEFASIPKTGYHFDSPKDLYPEKFREDTQRVFENLTPVCCVFAFKGNVQPSWIQHLLNWINTNSPNPSLTPSLIIVNKKGMIYRQVEKTGKDKAKYTYHFLDLTVSGHPGMALTHLLNELYSLMQEARYMQADYTYYFNADMEAIEKKIGHS